ncbi:MAG: hypothetical protein R6X35_14825 [Candidatus Krumholzibacteriia bacterium]
MASTRKKIIVLAAAGTLAAVLAVLLVGRNQAHGQAQATGTWTYRWAAPTTGAPVDHYQVQLVANGRDTTVIDRVAETTVNIPVELGKDYMVRVRGVDGAGRVGPYSAWSLMETFEESPPTNTSGSG